MTPSHTVITGGGGDLAQALATSLKSAAITVSAPDRSELDVTNSSLVKAYFKKLDDVDLLVCNAGITQDSTLATMGELEWDQVMQVNLKGAFLCARAVSQQMMKRRSGHIIFISSFSALQPPAGQANYAASKAALLGMMKSLSKELGSRNIRVNAILPGFLETKMTESVSSKAREMSLSKHSLGRFNTPSEVAEFITFLHQKMPHTSGQVFSLDSRQLT